PVPAIARWATAAHTGQAANTLSTCLRCIFLFLSLESFERRYLRQFFPEPDCARPSSKEANGTKNTAVTGKCL
ncbi:hypothetical protein, partial [Tateyamaria sp.]|uniref:hypothetical protein n=1 Tax=Tateyamaria sp. TaxID=1929288 RepID=UPI0032A13E5A